MNAPESTAAVSDRIATMIKAQRLGLPTSLNFTRLTTGNPFAGMIRTELQPARERANR